MYIIADSGSRDLSVSQELHIFIWKLTGEPGGSVRRGPGWLEGRLPARGVSPGYRGSGQASYPRVVMDGGVLNLRGA